MTAGGKKLEEGKGTGPSKRPAPRWCPRGITKTQKRRLQKMRQRELAKKKEEEERDYWFIHLWLMTKLKQMRWEKWLAKKEGSNNGNSSSEEAMAYLFCLHSMFPIAVVRHRGLRESLRARHSRL
jgi:hypothetical protein